MLHAMFEPFQGSGKNVLRRITAKFYLPFVSFQEGHIGLSRIAKIHKNAV